MLKPVIKWSGSKRQLLTSYHKLFPENIINYYEPFLGGGSTLPYIKNYNSILLNDINSDLISLWIEIRDNPQQLIEDYKLNWEQLKIGKIEYYNKVREEFNATRNPSLFLFLTRTCYNGLIRYNGLNEFNVSLHHNRNGIEPHKLESIIWEWNSILTNFEFLNEDFEIFFNKIKDESFVFMDPPYFNSASMYYGKFNYNLLLDKIKEKNDLIKWFLCFDCEEKLSEEIKEKINNISITKGRHKVKSSFRRLLNEKNDDVYECYYTNY